MKTYQKILIGAISVIVILIATVTVLLSSESVRQMIYREGITALSEKLRTRIKVDKIDVKLSEGGVALYGFEMEDRNHVTMLKVDTLVVGMYFWPLLHKEVDIDALYLHGVEAVLYKERPDTAANYQFVVDAFKPKKRKKKHALELEAHLKTFDVSRANFSWDVNSEPHKGKGKIDVNHLRVRDYHVTISGDVVALPEKSLVETDRSKLVNGKVKVKDLGAREENSGAVLRLKAMTVNTEAGKGSESEWKDLYFALPGKKYTRVTLKRLHAQKGGDVKDMQEDTKVTLEGLNLWTNNHKPRKNVIKPHRGAFDPGHMNSDINAEITFHGITKYTLSATVDDLTMYDRDSGLDVKKLTCEVFRDGDDIYVARTRISLAHTHLRMQTAHLILTRGRVAGAGTRGRLAGAGTRGKVTGFRLKPVDITADVKLSDISKPFAPVLNHFTTPLKLRVTCCGDIDRILFQNILVTGGHKSLIVTGQGDLCKMTGKKALSLHFWNLHMVSHGAITERLVGHFAKKVNLKMQRQMRMLGDVQYKGRFGVYFKKVVFGGELFSKFGNVKFDFVLNGFKKDMSGTMETSDFEIGKLMNIKHLGPINVHANYTFITARKKGQKKKSKGKLPQGTLSARIDGARYGIISLKHITTELRSDGKTATGTIIIQQKIRDIAIDVSYHQTTDDQSYHYKVRLQKISSEDKAYRKAQRKAEKIAKKAAKAAAKAAAKEAKEKEAKEKAK